MARLAPSVAAAFHEGAVVVSEVPTYVAVLLPSLFDWSSLDASQHSYLVRKRGTFMIHL